MFLIQVIETLFSHYPYWLLHWTVWSPQLLNIALNCLKRTIMGTDILNEYCAELFEAYNYGHRHSYWVLRWMFPSLLCLSILRWTVTEYCAELFEAYNYGHRDSYWVLPFNQAGVTMTLCDLLRLSLWLDNLFFLNSLVCLCILQTALFCEHCIETWGPIFSTVTI